MSLREIVLLDHRRERRRKRQAAQGGGEVPAEPEFGTFGVETTGGGGQWPTQNDRIWTARSLLAAPAVGVATVSVFKLWVHLLELDDALARTLIMGVYADDGGECGDVLFESSPILMPSTAPAWLEVDVEGELPTDEYYHIAAAVSIGGATLDSGTPFTVQTLRYEGVGFSPLPDLTGVAPGDTYNNTLAAYAEFSYLP